MQRPYDDLPGVVSTTVGYTGGEKANPTYHEVSAGGTGHFESIEVVYDPKKVTYEKLLDVFWHNVDPTNAHGQFCDNGSQYRTAIFVADDAQRKAAEASKKALEASGVLKRPIVTEILKAGTFWKAEDYHQSYYKKNPIRYSLLPLGLRTGFAPEGALGRRGPEALSSRPEQRRDDVQGVVQEQQEPAAQARGLPEDAALPEHGRPVVVDPLSRELPVLVERIHAAERKLEAPAGRGSSRHVPPCVPANQTLDDDRFARLRAPS